MFSSQTVANRVALGATYFRIVPLIIFALPAFTNIWVDKTVSFVMLILIVALDIFDGEFAKKYGVNTSERRRLDNLIDKIIVHGAFAVALAIYNFPVIWYLPFLIRDLVVVLLGGIAYSRSHLVVFPNRVHKLTILSVALVGIATLYDWNTLGAVVTLSLALQYITMFDYIGLFIDFTSTSPRKNSVLMSYKPKQFEGLQTISRLLGKKISEPKPTASPFKV